MRDHQEVVAEEAMRAMAHVLGGAGSVSFATSWM
jgi:hypothetical protein